MSWFHIHPWCHFFVWPMPSMQKWILPTVSLSLTCIFESQRATGFSPRGRHSDILCFISQILVELGFEDEWSSPPALLLSGAAHGKQQKEPLAGTADAEDSGLVNPLAHPFLILTSTRFCPSLPWIRFADSHSPYHRPQTNRHRQIHSIK